MPNRLVNENSLYLRQHAENPVDWHPWGAEAFAEARSRGLPVLVSIGYSSCHWCHVMAHECFENDYIAGLMNGHFVNIKVDREEHPEVDHLYMEAVQMITQHGGWPLNVFCLPDGRPFFGGTYFPPEDRGQGLVPWPQVLMRVSDYYQRRRGELEENADAILKNMAHADASIIGDSQGPGTATPWNPEFLVTAARAICKQHDDVDGGFGQAPKFPQAMTLDFLMELLNTARAQGEPGLRRRLEEVLSRTLQAMAFGGIYDQIGGGFARYSVDRHWLIPHFEKMLYDNGLLLDVYARAFLRFRDPLFADVLRETMRWLDREMTGEEGLFFSAIDADSEGVEGKFYVWNPGQVEEALADSPDQAAAFLRSYGISAEGNFEHGYSQPALLSGDRRERAALAGAREKLYEVRATRVWPARDEKRILSWNALAIRGRIEAAFALDDNPALARELARLDWIWENLRLDDGSLASLYYPGAGPAKQATLPDLAFLLETILAAAARADLIEAGLGLRWIDRARELAGTIRQKFADPRGAGYCYTAEQDSLLVQRRQEWVDKAIPSGNSSLLHSLASLYALTGEASYLEEFQQLRQIAIRVASRLPTGAGHALCALTREAAGIQVAKVAHPEALRTLASILRQRPWRRCFLLVDSSLPADAPFQLCTGNQCLAPESDAAAVAGKISEEPSNP